MLGMTSGVCEYCIGAMATAIVKENMIQEVVYPHCYIQKAASAFVLAKPIREELLSKGHGW